MSAPASKQCFGGIGRTLALGGFVFIFEADRDHRGQSGLLCALHRNQRLPQPRKRLADNEVHAFVHLHGELLVKRLAHAIGGRWAAGLIHPGQAQVARHQAAISRHLAGHADCGAIQFFQPVLQAHRCQLVAAGVEGERLQHFCSRLAKLHMQFAQGFGINQRHFRSERTRAHPSALFQFQQIAAVTQHGSFFQAFENPFLFHTRS